MAQHHNNSLNLLFLTIISLLVCSEAKFYGRPYIDQDLETETDVNLDQIQDPSGSSSVAKKVICN